MQQPTLQQRNKALVREVFDRVINGHDVSLARRYYPEDYRQRESSMPQGLSGLESILRTIFDAVPDIKVEILFQVAEEDLVVNYCEFSGTHVGDYFGKPGTGRRYRQQAVEIFRIADGLLVEHWGIGTEFQMVAS